MTTVEPMDTRRSDRAGHGSRRLYDRGCRCFPCSVANSRYLSTLAEHGPTRVPASTVTAHIERLERSGWTRVDIIEAAGLGTSTIWSITSGNQKAVNRRTATRIMRLQPQVEPPTWLVELARQVGRRNGATDAQVLSRSNNPEAVAARHQLMWVLREAGWSGSAIGSVLFRSRGQVYRTTCRLDTTPRWLCDLVRLVPDPPDLEPSEDPDEQTCEDCDSEPMGGGRWCLPCFQKRTAVTPRELEDRLRREKDAERKRRQRASKVAA